MFRVTNSGSSNRPETAAEAPDDICRKVGTNAMAENMPMPSTKPTAVASTNTLLRKNDSGMIGSSARDSTSTNSDAAITTPAPQSQVSGAPQPWSS